MAVAVVGSSLGSVLTGCESESDPSVEPTDAPVEELTAILIGQQELSAQYAQIIASFPELTTQLSDLAAQSTAHTDALVAAAPAAAAQAAATATEEPKPSATMPGDTGTALVDLRSAVARAASALRSAALRADGDLAALIGSCAASAACHVRLLG